MNKNSFFTALFCLMTLGIVSCQDDNNITTETDQSPSEENDIKNVKLINDQALLASRLVFVNTELSNSKSRAIKETPAPNIPDGAVKITELAVDKKKGVSLTQGESYIIDEKWEGTISLYNSSKDGAIDIYVNANATFTDVLWNNNVAVNIYILPNAVLTYGDTSKDSMVKIQRETKVYCWGNITTPDNKGFSLDKAGSVYIYGTEGEQFFVKNHSPKNKNDEVTFQVDTESVFYCEREMFVDGSALFSSGNSHFVNKLTVDGNMYVENQVTATFDDCTTVLGDLDFKISKDAIFNVNKYFQTNTLTPNHGRATIHLKDALFEILTEGTLVDKQNQKIIINGVESTYKSVFKGNKVYLDRVNDFTKVPGDETAAHFPSENFTGHLNLEGSFHYQSYGQKLPDEKTILDESNLSLPETVSFHANSWLPASEDGCRAETGKIPVIEILPPTDEEAESAVTHKYSATGIAFKDNMLYVCWHSNPKTNMDYAENEHSPSVDSNEDFGGIIDVININTYDITHSLFEQSIVNEEFKYNHIMYSDNKLYSAATSKKVGAALSKIALTTEGKFPSIDVFEEVRVSLTGNSANCVERVGNELITISGYSNGGINKFAIDDESNQSKKFINEESEQFQGKYVYYHTNNGKIVTLNNTERGIVTIYNSSMIPERSFDVGSIYPTDGKNVCICDNDYIYVCKGQNGLVVYDYQGNRIGGSKKHANGVDVDENFIYLAAGDGLAILDKNDIYVDDDGNPYHRTLKKFHYTGKGAANVKDETNFKQSANFVKKGPDGRIYVAYGIYGLHIYEFDN